jgi:hypothetical protein
VTNRDDTDSRLLRRSAIALAEAVCAHGAAAALVAAAASDRFMLF